MALQDSPMWVRWRIVLVVSVGVLLLSLQAHSLAQPADESARQAPSLFLAPPVGPSGTTVRASGKGYCNSGTVTLRWDDGTQLATGRVDEDGDISLTFPVPDGATPETHTVTSHSTCLGSTRRAEARFTVTPKIAGDGLPPTTPPEPPAPPSQEPPGPPAPPSQEPPSVSTLTIYEELIKRELERGAILYNPPERMRVGVVNRVEVRITRELTDELSEGLQGEGTPRVEELLVGTFMRAKLEGSAFDTTQIGSGVQQLAATGFREWRWDVTPIASGNQSLFFTISVLHKNTLIEEKVFERRIDVAVNPGYSSVNWLRNNWGPLIAALVGVVALVEAIRRLWRRRGDAGSMSAA